MTPYQNRLRETVQMRGHNVCFYAEIWDITPKLSVIPHLEPCCNTSFIVSLSIRDLHNPSSIGLNFSRDKLPQHLPYFFDYKMGIFYTLKNLDLV